MNGFSVFFVQLMRCVAFVFSISAAGEPLDVYVCAGQSNMVGIRTDASQLPPELQVAQPDVLVFDGTQWDVMSSPTNNGFGPEISFAYEMQKTAGHRIGIIKHSVGGTSLAEDWNPSTGYLYAELKQKVEAAMQSRPIVIKGMIWMQGERDSKMDSSFASAYKANLEDLIERVRTDFKNPELSFVAGRVNPPLETYPYVEVVREAQSSCQAEHYAFVDCDDLPKQSDKLHYTTPGLVELGRRFAQKTIELKNE